MHRISIQVRVVHFIHLLSVSLSLSDVKADFMCSDLARASSMR